MKARRREREGRPWGALPSSLLLCIASGQAQALVAPSASLVSSAVSASAAVPGYQVESSATPASAVLPTPDPTAAPAPGEEDAPGVDLRPWAERGDALAQVFARLDGLAGPSFQERATRAVGELPRETISVIVLRAAAPPPGLTTAALARRREAREDALELLANGLLGEQGALWREHLAALLARPTDSAGIERQQLNLDLCVAALSALGEVVAAAEDSGEDSRAADLRAAVGGLAFQMADGLHVDRAPRVRLAARLALERLHGLELDSPGEFSVFWTEGAGGSSARLALREARAGAEALLLDLVRLEPSRAFELAAGGSVRIQRLVPGILLEAVTAGALERDALLEELLTRLPDEVDDHAFHGQLAALLGLCADLPLDDPGTRRLRELLSELALRPVDQHSFSVLHGLTLVPVPESAQPAVAERVTRLFDQLVNDWRPLDADQVLQALTDLRGFCSRTGSLPELERLWRPLRFLLLDYDHEGSLELRRAAARTAGRMAEAGQLDDLLAVLSRDPEDELTYELIGALDLVARRLAADPDEESLRRVASALVPLLEHPGLDVRRATLDVLASEALAGVVVGDSDLPRSLLASMGSEESVDLLLDQLRLLARFERPRLVNELLSTPAVERLLVDARGLDELCQALRQLASGDARRLAGAARGLIELDQPQTVVARKERALALVMGLARDEALGLEPAVHLEILRWLAELRELRGGTTEDDATWIPSCRRALVVHLGVARGAEEAACELLMLEARLRSDILRAVARDAAVAERFELPERLLGADPARALFERALLECGEGDGGARRLAELRRDLARLELALGGDAQALQLLAEVVASGLGAGVLDTADLRELVRLVDGQAGPSLLELGHEVALSIIEREAWATDPAPLRHEDLHQLLLRARGWNQREALEAALERVEGLPAVGEESEVELWQGLVENPERHGELIAARNAAAEALATLQQADTRQADPQQADPQQAEPEQVAPEEKSGEGDASAGDRPGDGSSSDGSSAGDGQPDRTPAAAGSAGDGR